MTPDDDAHSLVVEPVLADPACVRVLHSLQDRRLPDA